MHKKIQGLDGATGNFSQLVKEEIIAILEKLFEKIETKHTTSHFYEAGIILIPKSERDILKEPGWAGTGGSGREKRAKLYSSRTKRKKILNRCYQIEFSKIQKI